MRGKYFLGYNTLSLVSGFYALYILYGVASRDPHGNWFFTRWCLYYILGSIAAVKRGSFQKSSGTHRLVLCRVLLWFGLDKHQSRISRNRVTFLSLCLRGSLVDVYIIDIYKLNCRPCEHIHAMMVCIVEDIDSRRCKDS